MTTFKRQSIAVVVMLALLMLAAVWSMQRLFAASAAARLASNDLTSCRQLATGIETLQNKPKIASSHDIGVEMLGRRITAASQQAGLDSHCLEVINPQTPRRVGNSPYVQKPTDLVLSNVTLPQLVGFLHDLTEGESGLIVSDLRLRAPRGEAATNLWDVETTITCLIYEPASAIGHRQP